MSVTSLVTKIIYSSDGINHIFFAPFYFINQTDLLVQAKTVEGEVTTYFLNTDYTVQGTPNSYGDYNDGANIVFNAIPPVGLTILIQRITNRNQGIYVLDNAVLTGGMLNHALDKLTLLIQEGFIDGYLGTALGPPTPVFPTYQYGNWFKNVSTDPGDVFGWILTTDNRWNAFGLISMSF